MSLAMWQVPAALGACPQSPGLGYADIIAAIIGPLAQGGADIYGTTVEAKLAKKELKQRQQEAAAQQEFDREQLKAQERQRALDQTLSIRQAQIRSAQLAQYMPYVLPAVGILALAVVTAVVVRSGRGRS